MGLFGPSWSWEEIQKKNALENDLRRENDRVLEKQRKENDRMLKKIEHMNNTQSNNSYSNNTIDYDYIAGRGMYYHDEDMKFLALFRGNISANKYISSIISGMGSEDSSSIMITLFPFTGCFCISFFVFFYSLISGNWGPLISVILFFTFIVAIAWIIRILVHLPAVIIDKTRIKKTICYKDILDKIINVGKDNIRNIYVNSDMVVVVLTDNSTKKFVYSTYNFPKLPLLKQAILIGCLIDGMKASFSFSINYVLNGCYALKTNELNLSSFCMCASNNKIIDTETKENYKRQKQQEKERKQNIRSGKTW